MIMETAEAGYETRNSHMRGTTNVLRLLFGIPLGTDYKSEFMNVGGERVHLFDAFALVNYLLCSAVGNDGKTRGFATPTMMENCHHHFREALRILEPSVIIVQGKTFWPKVQGAFDLITHRTHEVYTAKFDSIKVFVASFTHPSAPNYLYNWGINERTPYLLQTVAPSIAWIRDQILSSR
jgi:uracil-DNA glycosylase